MSSSEYDFNLTRNQIIQRAFRIVGALSLGEVLSAEQSTQAVEALNTIVKEWTNYQIHLWTQIEENFLTEIGDYQYNFALNPGIQGVEKAWIRDASGTDTPLEIITWSQFADIPEKAETGKPTHIALCFSMSNDPTDPKFMVWPVPDAEYEIHVRLIRTLKDMDSSSGNPDAPQKALKALIYALADDLADEYPIPMAERERISRKAASLFAALRGADVTVSDCDFVKGAYDV